MTDLRQSPQYGKYMEKIGWKVEKVNGCQIFIKKLPLIGAFIKIQRPEKIPFSEIEKLAEKHRAFAVCLEPSNIKHKQSLMLRNKPSIINHKYHPTKSPYAPPKTLQIDLTLSEKELLAQMKKDARYSIRKAQENQLQLIKVPLKTFHQVWKKFNYHRLWIPSFAWLKALKDSFGRDFFQLVVGDPPFAGVILLKHDKTMYYYYAFSSKEGQKLFAPYLLVWEGIKLAKKQGCQILDFEGIEDPRFKSTRKWRGFTHFKKSFGGKEIEYPGSFSKYRLPL